MVTTNCRELTGKGTCTVPLSGSSFEELKDNIFAHAQQDHTEEVKSMTPEDQKDMIRRIQEIYQQKSAVLSGR